MDLAMCVVKTYTERQTKLVLNKKGNVGTYWGLKYFS